MILGLLLATLLCLPIFSTAHRQQHDIDPCTAGTNITFDGKTYGTKYAIETPAPPGSDQSVDGVNTPVSARVIGTLANGSVFWDSKGAFAYNFNATPRHLIVGFDVGSYGMKVGETRKLCIPENEGYGPAGKPPVIPPAATLIFQLECLSVGSSSSSYPDTIDWTSHVRPPVKHPCAANLALVAVETVESRHSILTNATRLTTLSLQQLVDCDNHQCGGGFMSDFYQYMVGSDGVCTSAEYPATPTNICSDGMSCQSNPVCSATKCAATTTVQVLNYTTVSNEDDLAVALAGGPVAVSVAASGAAFEAYTSGVLDDPSCGSIGNHAMLLVGMGKSRAGVSYWTLKNSWGPDWGEHGYIRIVRGKNMCGIAMDAVYPVL
jgi:hypothetical protein